jgi:tyrosyl-tRNA synthetase
MGEIRVGTDWRKDPGLAREVESQVSLIADRSIDVVTMDELRDKVARSLPSGKPLKVKLGVDPTAPDLHLGHVVVMKKLRDFQRLGHEIYFVIGDFTAMIGDPSGKSQTRPQLSKEEVLANAETYRQQATTILDPARTHLVFNSQWLSPMSFKDVIHLASRFTVARMLERDDFQGRYQKGSPIGVHEFMYPLAQAYDSVAIGSDVELGGTDQTFNLLVGRSIQKEYGQESQVALTMPILVGLDGTNKMSKSLGNYIGVKDEPRDMYGKVMSIPDSLMASYKRLVVCDSEASVNALVLGIKSGEIHPMDAKMNLAFRIVSEFHGDLAAKEAQDEFIRVFRERELPTDLDEVELPEVSAGDTMGIALLLARTGLVSSSSEARRLIKAGAIRIDGVKIGPDSATCIVRDGMLLQVGKRRICRVTIGR